MGEDDEEAHYLPSYNEVVFNRYRVRQKLGKGTFGSVFAAIDLEAKRQVALKIIRAIPKYTQAGHRELGFICEVAQASDPHRANCAEILASFMFRGHLVLVFPLYGISLIELLRYNNFKGYNLEWTRELGRSFIQAVRVLHDLKIIHSDIKPENIVSKDYAVSYPVRDRLFVHPPGANLVLIDFGSALRFKEPRPSLVCTRQYRPPEVVIQTAYDEKIDIWSIGCVLYEIATGKTLFRTHNSIVHLAMIERLLGPMPAHMARRIEKYAEFYVCRAWQLPDDVGEEEIIAYNQVQRLEAMTYQFSYNFTHLLKCVLCWDPAQRITCAYILEHPFFVEAPKETKCTQVTCMLTEVVKNVVSGDISFEDFVKWYKKEFY